MRKSTLMIVVLLMLLPFAAFAAGEASNVRKVSVAGKAENTLEAHNATIRLTIRHVKPEMSQSHTALTETLSRMTKDLKSAGLADKDIKRSLVLQGADYSWEKDSRVLKGYYSECYVEVSVNDIKKMSDVYRVLAGYKAITIESTEFERDDEFDVRKAAYEKALLAAKKKAEFMAQTLGARLGRVHSIAEDSSDGWYGVHAYAANVSDKGEVSGSQAAYGTVKITARVMVEFELE